MNTVILVLLGCATQGVADSQETPQAPPLPYSGELTLERWGHGHYPNECTASAAYTGEAAASAACPACDFVFRPRVEGETCGVLPADWVVGVDLDDPSRVLEGDGDVDRAPMTGRWDPDRGRLDFAGDLGNPAYPWPNDYSYTSEFLVGGWVYLPG